MNGPGTILDVILAGLLLFSGLLAYLRGFVHEVLSITAWIGAALAAMHGLPLVRPYARDVIHVGWAADAAAGAAIFLVTLLLLSMATRAVSQMVHSTSLGSLDRALGFFFGILRGAALIGLAYILVVSLVEPTDRPEWLTRARALPVIERVADMIRAVVPDELAAARTSIDNAAEKARSAMEAERAFQKLSQPVPTAGPRRRDDSGYDDSQRRDMDKLFQTTQ
ncbi:MAG: CvpA family protein [Alphaproteobacteria bacterium]